ncbi:unnamed protein product [marine sediment metagenome]|uniref:Uncharacterized protein n=1 Tax=marine sediment metagenome TaxID=412755 RepID=X1NGX2_9ZZZZ
MANVKLNNKRLLEKLQAEITLKLGKKMSQQEVLDKSIEFTYNRLNEFFVENIDKPAVTKEFIERLRESASDAPLYHLEKSDDELIYSL